MTSLDFFVGFAASGRVEGVGLNSAPEDWSDHLGADFIDDKSKSKKRLRRDYGLVELGFSREDGGWRCFVISIQVHRLWWHDELVPEKLRSKYGEFPKAVSFEELCRRLEALKLVPRLIPDEPPGEHDRYYINETKILIDVPSSRRLGDPEGIPSGSISSMHLSRGSEVWAQPRKN